ncbi:hypothetical protein GALMADRAFT_625081 [Galerina marginata CBS 339.88]|uniref:Uncharacterized protein n=1 Tax=Galerina marginata (strain CBS 339.88) TaxID=685588 RepID=A0A067SRY0_GALM3|nr:hypothetical protein GALMADRAFT_625081 [Galerina marginata CBS 339.88]
MPFRLPVRLTSTVQEGLEREFNSFRQTQFLATALRRGELGYRRVYSKEYLVVFRAFCFSSAFNALHPEIKYATQSSRRRMRHSHLGAEEYSPVDGVICHSDQRTAPKIRRPCFPNLRSQIGRVQSKKNYEGSPLQECNPSSCNFFFGSRVTGLSV